MFRNFYCCYECDETWEDDYECQVDDDCPSCGARHNTPYFSADVDEDGHVDDEDFIEVSEALYALRQQRKE